VSIEEDRPPKLVSAITFGLAMPSTYWLYSIIWCDPLSDAFFHTYELTLMWIATINALDGASAVGLGYIDYKLITGNPDNLIYGMRKKRLAFAKFAFMMAIACMFMVDKPSPNCVAPLVMGSIYNAMKIGT